MRMEQRDVQTALELLGGLRCAHLGLSYRSRFRFAGRIAGFYSRSLGDSGFRSRLCGNALLRRLLLIEVFHYARYIRPSLVIRRHALILLHPQRSRIVSGQRLHQIEVVTLQQFPQILCSAFYIRLRIECIRNAELRSRSRHQLHQPLRSLRRNRPRIESTLSFDHAVDQVGIKPVTSARRIHHVIQINRISGEAERCTGCPISRGLCEKTCPELVEGWGLCRYSGSRKPGAGSRQLGRWDPLESTCRHASLSIL